MLLVVYVTFLFLFLLESHGHNMEGRIIGGSYANIKSFPHCAYLTITCAGFTFGCGASVLNQRLLLTAAHCVEDCMGGKFDIFAIVGTDNIDKGKITSQVQRYLTHAEYDTETVEADIALMYMKTELPLGQQVQRVLISPTVTFQSAADVAGWGIINKNQDTDVKLKTINQKPYPFAQCQKRFSFLRKGMMCAVAASTSTGPASGDSGSALVLKSHHQVGLVSTAAGSTGVIIYTNVTFYFKWIQDKSTYLNCFKKNKVLK